MPAVAVGSEGARDRYNHKMTGRKVTREAGDALCGLPLDRSPAGDFSEAFYLPLPPAAAGAVMVSSAPV